MWPVMEKKMGVAMGKDVSSSSGSWDREEWLGIGEVMGSIATMLG